MKKMRAIAVIMAAIMAVPTMPAGLVYAEEADIQIEEVAEPGVANFDPTEQGYSLKWEDNFDGDSLNRDAWNVELHEKGWVNGEWQEYIDDSKVLEVSDGTLKIKPVKETERKSNLLKNAGFTKGLDNWEETIANWSGDHVTEASHAFVNNGIKYSIKNPGTDDWHVQLKQTVSLKAGKTYIVSFKAMSTESRSIIAGVQNASYAQYKQAFPELKANEVQEVSYSFTPSADDSTACLYFSLGQPVGKTIPASDVTITDISLKIAGEELAAAEVDEDEELVVTETKESANLLAGAEAFPFEIAVTNGDNMGEKAWDLQKAAYGINLKSGSIYKFRFTASATADRTIVAGMQMGEDPWTGYLNREVALTSEAKEFEFEFTAGADDSSAMAFFNIGTMMESEGNTAKETPDATISVSNVELVELIEETEVKDPDEEETSEEETSEDEVEYEEIDSYYSGRVSTQNKETFTYGYYECRAKVPAGQGYLPAFWLMANDENIYGQWPECGEIDCMEVMGQNTNKLYGTIHYGNPHEESQGTYTISEGASFSDDYHTFGCEWEPDKIIWYVDGVEYYRTQNWYSRTVGDEKRTYPAPFDQPFYIILNLAVGGNWVGNPDEKTNFENNPFEIDYVRVYQKDSYDENVTEPPKAFNPRQPINGNYINNGDFAVNEDLTDDVDWKFLLANGGEATATISNKSMNIAINKEGSVDYSVQLVQADIPLEKGATYEVSFDASAKSARSMNVDVKAPDHGYSQYMTTFKPSLTTRKQSFKTTFVMQSDSDENARLEFNMGAAGTAGISISNVKFTKIKDYDPTEEVVKTVRPDGNYIYNGSFSQGTAHMGYWDFDPSENSCYVTSFADGRRLYVPAGTILSLGQTKLAFKNGKRYKFSMDVEASAIGDEIEVTVGGRDYTIAIDAAGKKTYSFGILEADEFSNSDISIRINNNEGELYLDNITLKEDALLQNSEFSNGSSGYEIYVDSSANASVGVVDEELVAKINNTGDQDWKVQIKQNNVKLEEGKSYRLKFKAKTNLEGGRDIRVIMQGLEPLGWPVYSGNNRGIYRIGKEYQEYVNEFRMKNSTDAAAFLSICLGNVTEQITTSHTVTIDDVTLEEIELDVYDVTFDSNGEEIVGSLPDAQRVDKWDAPVKPSDVTSVNEDVTFSGWYIDEACTTLLDFDNYQVTRNMTVYAGWKYDESIKVDLVGDEYYTGKAIKPVIRVTQGGQELVLNKDYKVTYKNNINTNKDGVLVVDNGISKDADTGVVSYNYDKNLPTIVVTGITNFSDAISFNFNIVPYGIDKNGGVIETADALAANSRKDTAISLKVKANGKYIVKNTDYTAVLIAKDVKNADGETVETDTEYADLKVLKGYTGTFEIKVTGKKNYSGTITKEIVVDAEKISVSNAAVSFKKLDTTGVAITTDELKAVTTVKVAGKVLTADDFDVEFVDSEVKNAGSYQVVVTGKGAYVGTKLATAKITGIDIKKAKITIGGAKVFDRANGGNNDLKVMYGETELTEDTDYTVTVTNDVNVGTAKVVVAGIGKYSGSVTKTYRINAFKLANDADGLTYSKDLGNVEYISKGVTPDVNISYKGVKLVNGVDYTLGYAKNAVLGTAKVTVRGKGNFNGSITDITFSVVPGDIVAAGTVITANDVVYNAKPGKYMSVPKLTTATGKALAAGTDYSKTYKYELVNADGSTELLDAKSAPAVGSVIKVTVEGAKGYTGTISTTYRVAGKNIASGTFKLATKQYTGKEVKVGDADFTVASVGTGKNKKELVLGRDFVIESYTNNIKVGTAKVTIRGINEFGGTKVLTYKIVKKGFINFLGMQIKLF